MSVQKTDYIGSGDVIYIICVQVKEEEKTVECFKASVNDFEERRKRSNVEKNVKCFF